MVYGVLGWGFLGDDYGCVTDVTGKNATFSYIYCYHLYIQSSRVYKSLYFICHICHTYMLKWEFLLNDILTVFDIIADFIRRIQLSLLVCLRHLIYFVEPSLSCVYFRKSQF